MSDLEQKNQSETEIETENGAPAEAQAPAAKPTLFQRYKAHMKKWWWVYVIVVCCIVLVVVLPIVYVGVPRFASKYINDYEYDYTGLKITNPTPDSFHVHQLQDLKVSGPFSSASGHLSAFNAAVYSLLDSNADSGANNDPLSNFPIPDIAFGGGKGFTIDQDLNISCVDCLSRVAAAAASDQEIKMLVKGDSNLKVGALPNAHLNIHKILTMQGYNVKEFLNTKGSFNVTGIDLMKEKNDQGYNVNATVSFKNPSPFIVEMGTATFNLSISGTPAGNVTVPNLFLNEGITETYILGDIDENQLIHGGIGGSDSGSSLGDVTIDLQGDRVVYQGVEIPYFTAAIRAVQAPVKVNLLDYMSDIL